MIFYNIYRYLYCKNHFFSFQFNSYDVLPQRPQLVIDDYHVSKKINTKSKPERCDYRTEPTTKKTCFFYHSIFVLFNSLGLKIPPLSINRKKTRTQLPGYCGASSCFFLVYLRYVTAFFYTFTAAEIHHPTLPSCLQKNIVKF